MNVTSISRVKQSQLIKISLLVSLLLSLPKTIFIYRMIEHGKMDFSEVAPSEFILQFLFFFLFSWVVLQISANWAYQFIQTHAIRILTNIAIGIVVLVLFLQLLVYIYPFFTDQAISKEERGFLSFNYATILIILFFVARILRLQIIQKENLLENEQLKQQNLQNELTALKNQVDPHFLFNSLNSLNSLIRDNKEATAFVTKLSFMYRYILQSGDRDLVSVEEELKFLESYIFLIKTRYRNRFSIEMDIDAADLEKEVPPLALQLLVENAVKHNEISESHPLQVKIYSKDNAIFVENTIRPRTTLAEGTGNGLTNLDKRYYLLGKQKMNVTTENNIFCVKIPLLKTS
ncbi:sensor histidine kinase [Maribacter halichondriae]|uniref:sensor histidine kinase n=1 Tax=Maribacter halichondriae TaxID=2980554 RepID=UPI0023599425|nr:histidine kinase [Maribacter sp. Hal144]